ncbi:sensor histidine kinase [Zoogloea sp. LCSB751]|uniref:sensor histidine kinase n=1 Tax=Zoogloea sp. LCSB751 TaxID=1965277 RepID=UPI0009A550FE|nr:sensor histidine kinase [Zoogloea sp. LCSB751]
MDVLANINLSIAVAMTLLSVSTVGGACAAVARFRRAKEEMRLSKEFFQSTFDSAAVGMAVADFEGRYIKVNQAMCEFVGYSEAELLGMSYHDITHPDDLADNVSARARMLDGTLPKFQMEKRYVRKDGRVVWALMVVSEILDKNGRMIASVGQMLDIDTQKQAERALLESRRELRELSHHQKTLLEQERKHIAREIHDELGQRLTALKMDISLLRIGFGHNPELFRMAERMRELAEGTIDVVRQIASNLRPAALDLGLVPAIEWLLEDLQRRSEIRCRFYVCDDELAMDEARATVVFRLVQESLTNIARHARARHVEVSLAREGDRLRLRIADDGCGFDPQATDKLHSFGLLGMRERVLALDGNLLFDSSPGRGTTVSIELPLLEKARP